MLNRNSDWIEAFSDLQIEEVYYLAPLDNLDSILTNGILAQNEVTRRGLSHLDISEPSVQQRRELRGLHDSVPFYFARKTPMSSVRRELNHKLCILVVRMDRLCQRAEQLQFTDGNGGAGKTQFYSQSADLVENLPLEVIRADRWWDYPGGKRRRCAELLVQPAVSASTIKRIEVAYPQGKPVVDAAIERARPEQSIDWTPICTVNREAFFVGADLDGEEPF